MVFIRCEVFARGMHPLTAPSAFHHLDVVIVRFVAAFTDRTEIAPLPKRDTLGAQLQIEVPAGHHSSVGVTRLAAYASDASPYRFSFTWRVWIARLYASGVLHLSTVTAFEHLLAAITLATARTGLTFWA